MLLLGVVFTASVANALYLADCDQDVNCVCEQIEKANLSWTMGNYLSVPKVDGIYTKSMGTSLYRVLPAKILRITKEKKPQMGSTGSN